MKILALDIGGTAVKSGMFCDGRLTSFEEFPTQADLGAAVMMKNILDYILKQAPDAVGISTSGQVDPTDGSIAFATDAMPGYTGFPVKQYIHDHTGLPVSVENDVNSAAIGEAHFGAAKGISDFLCLTIGTGIGGAIFINGKLYIGANGIAGEVGHMTTHLDGVSCNCGNKGCYEAYASTSALVRRAEKELGKKVTGRDLFAARAEAKVSSLFDEWADEVVAGLTSLTYSFNPQAIVLGGGMMSQPEIIALIREKYAQRVIPSFSRTEILSAELGNQAGIYGAYYSALELTGSQMNQTL